MKDAVLLGSDVLIRKHPAKQEIWQRLAQATYIQRTWGDAYGYALVATGRAEIMLDAAMAVWDCGPMSVVMEEAGGTFTDWNGQANIYTGNAICTNGSLFEQVMSIVQVQD